MKPLMLLTKNRKYRNKSPENGSNHLRDEAQSKQTWPVASTTTKFGAVLRDFITRSRITFKKGLSQKL